MFFIPTNIVSNSSCVYSMLHLFYFVKRHFFKKVTFYEIMLPRKIHSSNRIPELKATYLIIHPVYEVGLITLQGISRLYGQLRYSIGSGGQGAIMLHKRHFPPLR